MENSDLSVCEGRGCRAQRGKGTCSVSNSKAAKEGEVTPALLKAHGQEVRNPGWSAVKP